MLENTQKVNEVSALLSKLAGICDSGFALAAHIRYTRPTLLFQTYAADWIDQYSENGYMLADPTVHWGLAHTGAMDWAELEPQDEAGVLKAARDYGLTNGWTYAVGPATSRSLASMTRSQPFSTDQRAEICGIIDRIHDLTDGFEHLPAAVQEDFRALK
ncbi:MAG: hypothetical protein A3D16_13625 [Rhodobacterales bacterium RIFCSPHIGHO2_02_FULL_62_130]|jgi:LuxR family transcriptional regulator|nr:MAG: hypothetical protein A3D16_13625 [Rhodobacterales bacterium RIFCSPHIGHO2_02_FULL_62_130]OHC60004.1 MAG: hypothetical protein A3E48_15795 [Rhodobacterales bacterium RIFCSPHIGHO2_12_FULL_62_75]HCZ01765.1 hypothetical protein [Rhodobacter sp.]